ncbi:hypothetical protein PGTUg99_011671 [Puccinia graminis f. sp. tritici]|uniref:Phospholipid/glycerol acyltransferase domain-containing protein n=1 Tax=Puccinia graminis f. sp. tritici TaxID=56615 RepID=A0A5B0S533_PUCGR|nr:hypothetical protein PGTUg99_011671 [Puccinia graminis f. sp. tritici]
MNQTNNSSNSSSNSHEHELDSTRTTTHHHHHTPKREELPLNNCITQVPTPPDTPNLTDSDQELQPQPQPHPNSPSINNTHSLISPPPPPLQLAISNVHSDPIHLAHYSPINQPTPAPPKLLNHTLQDTLEDLSSLLQTFRKILPLSHRLAQFVPRLIHRFSRSCVQQMAQMLYNRNLLASNVAYDLAILLLKWIINLFFREIRPRGSHKIPDKGPLIFVAAPHHNQFLDPVILMSEVRAAESARRVSFLTAEKSMKRPFIGLIARVMQSISVTRATDDAKDGTGRIFLSSKQTDPCILHGKNTKFTHELAPKKQILLSKQLGFVTVEVVEILDDCCLRVKKPFPTKGVEALREEGNKIEAGIDSDSVVGVPFKILPYVDQTQMYGKVFEKLKNGGCLGIFPEGGSHDRTDLLPLKAGVSIMALGAMSSNPEITVRIVPVGLSYFHPHRFRSRAVVEFGTPIEIPQELVRDFEKGDDHKKAAIGKVMELVYDGLKSVTVQAPDYDTLQVIQAARRLYRPPDRHVSLSTVVELNKRFITGYLRYKDEPRVMALKSKTLEYNKSISYLGLKDHQVEKVNRPWWKSLILLCFRAGLVTGWGVLALPGVILNSPMFICASIVSRKKAREALAASSVKIAGRDVLATWKVLVSLGLAPPLYIIYVAVAIWLAVKYEVSRKYVMWIPMGMLFALPSIGYSALKFGEVGMDVYKSLRPLLLSLLGDQNQLERVRKMRSELQAELHSVIEEYAPKIWENFEQTRIHTPSADVAPLSGDGRKSLGLGYGGRGVDLINHPLSWLDERLFGWSQYDSRPSQQKRRRLRRLKSEPTLAGERDEFSTSEEATTTDSGADEDGDYDSVVGMLSRFTGAGTGSGSRSRRTSRGSRSRSQLNLTELVTTDDTTTTGSSAAVKLGMTGDLNRRRKP